MNRTVSVASDVARSARVLQVEGIFDVPPTSRVELSWNVNMPLDERPWNVGAILGPSGSGKSRVARVCFTEQMARFDALSASWLRGKSLLDGFPNSMSISAITDALSSVGFSSPPAWVRPFDVLSNGEQFRVMMARVLAETPKDDIAVVDEFTSVVDRTVAQVGSYAIARSVRRAGQKFVAVTCHDDVLEWLQPEWVYRPVDQTFTWRSVQPRPQVRLHICRVHHSVWSQFHRHHYLTADLNKAAICFAAFAEFPGQEARRLVAFDSWLPFFGKCHGQIKRTHRLVCLPDFQGLGIAQQFNTALASMWKGLGFRPVLGTTHPAIVNARRRDKRWVMTKAPTRRGKGHHYIDASRSTNRNMASFEYVGAAMSATDANRMLNNWTKV